MDKSERDELEAAAKEALSESWCLHPNGTSVWTGEEYEPDPDRGAPQYVVCQAPLPFNEVEVRRMEFIATCNPHAVLELLEFYGLSDTHFEHGQDDDEVCSACGLATTEGHTHIQCFERGKYLGALDENIDCATKLFEAVGIERAGFFDEALKEASHLLEDAQILVELVEPIGLTERQQLALKRVLGR